MSGSKSALLIGILAFLCGCAHESAVVSGDGHTVIRHHAPPPASIIPEPGAYTQALSRVNGNGAVYDSLIGVLVEKSKIQGISVAVVSPNQGVWSKNAGSSAVLQTSNAPIFYWASVTKLITSTVIHQLIQEGKLRLDDSLARWFPDIENARGITVKMLLNHTSGIYNFGSDSAFHWTNRYFSPSELLEISRRHKNDFSPGQGWSYSNTGYLLLALMAEQIEQKPFSEIVSQRIAIPLGLKSLKALGPNEFPSNLVIPAVTDTTIQNNYSTPLGAGNVVGNSQDLAVFLANFMTGKFIPQTAIVGMLNDLYGMYDVGMYTGEGIMLYDFGEINQTPQTWIGHSGGIENYKAVLVYDVRTRIICAVSISQNLPAEAVARMLITATQNP